MKKSLESNVGVERKYRRAESLMQGYIFQSIVANSTVFPVWIKDSHCFWYEREINANKKAGIDGGNTKKWGREYRLVNAKRATNNLAFDHAILAEALAKTAGHQVDENHLPINNVDMQLDHLDQVLSLQFCAFDRPWIFDVCSGLLKQRPEEINAKENILSPDKEFVIFTRGYNLWLRHIGSGDERPLTDDGEEHFCYAAEGNGWGFDLGGNVQARWSPDSKKIFTLQRDCRRVLTLPVVEHVPQDGTVRPKVQNIKIAMKGDEHVPEYRMVVIDIESGRLQPVNYPNVPITRNSHGYCDAGLGWWGGESRYAYFVDLARGYRRVRLVKVDTQTDEVEVLFEENSDTHINLMVNADEYPTIFPLFETNELIWFSERSGWAHLYLYDLTTGELKNPITTGEWVVRNILSFDHKRREVFLHAMGRTSGIDPYYRELVRVNIDTGVLTTIASGDIDHYTISNHKFDLETTIVQFSSGRDIVAARGVSHDCDYVVTTRSRADSNPVSVLLDRNGEEIIVLEEGDMSAVYERVSEDWQWPEPVKMIAADGQTDIYGLVFRPSDFSPEKSYPIIDYGFNVPDVPRVSKGSFSNGVAGGRYYLEAAALAELGFIVVSIDGRGTSYRSKAFQDECYGWIESANNLDDHVAGIEQLSKRYPYLDVNRVGICSLGGGAGAVQGLLHYPEFYKVGVNTALHDSRLMAAPMWSDKFEGVLDQSSDPSDARSRKFQYPEAYADRLMGKLLLVHGMLNICTAPAATFRVIEALHKANKDFDLILLPNLGHAYSTYPTRRAWDYFVTHLQGVKPPREFNLCMAEDLQD